MALVPLAAYRGLFGRLFWFGDEFDLIDQIDRVGFWRWIWLVFAENFVPLFKVLWGGGVLVFHGSYMAMIVLLWLTHALNVSLLGRVMRACAVPWAGVAVALVAFGLTSVNVETLAWTVQWSAVLSTTFMLLALDSHLRSPFGRLSYAWVAASALSFSRGVLTGPLLAMAGAWPGGEGGGRRYLRSVAYLAPAAAVAVLIALLASGNHSHLGGHLGDAAVYGLWYYLLNPGYRMLGVGSWGWHTVAAMGACKLALVAWALARSRGRQRLLLSVLVASDLGYAVLLGVGRYHTGLPTVVSSRYEYASLVGIAPVLGFWVCTLVERIPLPRAPKSWALFAALAAVALAMCAGWKTQLEPFTRDRGVDSRRILLGEANPGPYAVPGIPFMPTSRAREIIAAYNLH
jgi:hypothetical protein